MHMSLIFLVPGLFIVFGWLWKHGHYPSGRNAFFGYRTVLSMQSDEAWKFAQETYGRTSWRIGWILLMLSVGAVLALRHLDVLVGKVWIWFVAVQSLIAPLPLFAFCECALKRKFVAAVGATDGSADKRPRPNRPYGRAVVMAWAASVILIPVTFIFIGWLGQHGMAAGSVNGSYGYRTALSMQSQAAWDFAQTYFAQVAWQVGWLSLIVSVCGAALLVWKMRRKWYFYLLMIAFTIIQCAGAIACAILPVESALKERFGGARSANGEVTCD